MNQIRIHAVEIIRNVRWSLLLSRLFLILGVLLCLGQYLCNRSLWFDEAMLARNILDRGPLALMGPLDYQQGAPVLFLLLVKATTLIFGSCEYALRLIPFTMAIAGLLLFYQVAKLYLDRHSVPLAVFIFAFSYQLVYYSAEAKQYSTDVASAVLLFYLFLRLIDSNRIPNTEIGLLGVAGCTAIFLSHPSVFVLAGIANTLIILVLRRRLNLSPRALSSWLALWLSCLLFNYFLFIKPLSANRGLHEYWQSGFLPIPFSLHTIGIWLHAALSYLHYLGYYSCWGYFIAGLTALAGGTQLMKGSPATLAIFLLFSFTVLASLLRFYAFSERLILFLAPFVILTAVKGVQITYARTNGLVFAALGIALVYPSLQSMHDFVLHPIVREEVKPILSYLYHKRMPGDHVYIYFGATHAVHYYRRNNILGQDLFFYGENSRTDRSHYVQDIVTMTQFPRVWFLFAHVYQDEERFFLSHIDGKLLDEYHQPGASLYLYGFDRPCILPEAVEVISKRSL